MNISDPYSKEYTSYIKCTIPKHSWPQRQQNKSDNKIHFERAFLTYQESLISFYHQNIDLYDKLPGSHFALSQVCKGSIRMKFHEYN